MQAFAAMIFPIFKPIFFSAMYEYCERMYPSNTVNLFSYDFFCSFGCQHFHFTFWFLMAAAGVLLALVMIPLSYLSVNQLGLIEGINVAFNGALILIGFGVIWVLKCNKL